MSEEINITSDYKPGVKQSLFHASSKRFKVLKGALGSGKTRMAVEEVNTLMAEYPGIVINVMRKTMPALRDSTLHEFLKFLDPNLGTYSKKHENFNCGNHSLVRFRGMDEATKQKGTEPAVVVMDEADEFTYEDFLVLKGRIRQVNRSINGRPYPLYLILLFNPVDETHWLYKQFVLNADSYEQAGGLLLLELTTYDNLQNLPHDYIATTTAGMSPDEIDRYIMGKWGALVKGKPVYADVLRADLHLMKWQFNPSVHVLLRGWDFGYNHPACVFRIKDPLNRKNIDFSMLGEKEFIDVFANRVLAQTLARYGPSVKVFDYCDPRGHDKTANSTEGAESAVAALNELGIHPIGERGIRAYKEPGIKIVRKEFSTLINAVPELTINPEDAMMRAAYFAKYVRGDDGEPVKDGFYEHPADADRYIAYNDRSNAAVRDAIIRNQQKRDTKPRNRITGY